MADLIDRKSVIDVIHKAIFDFFDIVDDDDESPMTYKDEQLLTLNKAIVTKIKALPSADIDLSGFSDRLWRAAYERGKAEVVRCKDCKHFDSGTNEDGKLFFKCLGWVYGGTSEDDFCSHGERNNDGFN